MVGFVLSALVYAAVLSFIPWVQHKGYVSCFLVALIMAVVRIPLVLFAIPLFVSLAIFSAIPIIGWTIGPLLLMILSLLVNTVALYVADRVIEDFKIATIGHTALTALVTGFVSGIVLKLLGA